MVNEEKLRDRGKGDIFDICILDCVTKGSDRGGGWVGGRGGDRGNLFCIYCT